MKMTKGYQAMHLSDVHLSGFNDIQCILHSTHHKAQLAISLTSNSTSGSFGGDGGKARSACVNSGRKI